MSVARCSGVKDPRHLFYQSPGKHLINSGIDFSIEFSPRAARRSQESVVTKGFLVAEPMGGNRFSGQLLDLQRSENSLPIRWADLSRCLGVESGQLLKDCLTVLVPVVFEASP